VTPFDVIKTRLQTQQCPEPLFVPSSHLPPPSASIRPDPSTSKALSVRPSPAAVTSTNFPTCCQKTFFNANLYDNSLLCRFDPRLSTSSLPASGFHSASPNILRMPSLITSGSSLAPSPVPASTCPYPTPSVAAAELSSARQHFKGSLDALVKIARHEGVGTLWRGLGPTLAISIPSQAGYMVGYDNLRAYFFLNAPSTFRDSSTGKHTVLYNALAPLLAGSIARSAVVSVFSPLELLRTRLQSVPSGPDSSTWDVIKATLRLTREQGWTSLWRGLLPTLWRDVPFSGIYWATYEGVKKALVGRGMGESTDKSERGEKTFAVAFVSGATSGMVCNGPLCFSSCYLGFPGDG
jgi:solute carrier family 25 protein 39/40